MQTFSMIAKRLRRIEEALQEAMDAADEGEEALIGALLSEARDAVIRRYSELPPDRED